MRIWKERGVKEDVQYIHASSDYPYDFLRKRFSYLAPESRAPKSNKKSLSSDQEALVLKFHANTNRGYAGASIYLQRLLGKEVFQQQGFTLRKIR